MTFRTLGIRFALALGSLLVASSAHAECITPGEWWLREPTVELVFSGTAVEITQTAEVGYRAAFNVDRVWKGAVPKRIDLYVWELSAERPRFEAGHHYIALAQKVTDNRTRQGVGLDRSDMVAYTPIQCSDSLAPDIAAGLGEGRPPK